MLSSQYYLIDVFCRKSMIFKQLSSEYRTEASDASKYEQLLTLILANYYFQNTHDEKNIYTIMFTLDGWNFPRSKIQRT